MQQRRPIYTWATLGSGDTDIERMALEPWLQLRTHTRPGAGVRAFLEGVISPAQRFPLGRHQICPSKSLMIFAGPSDQTSPVPLSCFPPALKRGGRGPAPTHVLRWYIPPMMRRTWCRGAQPAPTHVPQHIATEGGVDGRGVWGGAHCLPATKSCRPALTHVSERCVPRMIRRAWGRHARALSKGCASSSGAGPTKMAIKIEAEAPSRGRGATLGPWRARWTHHLEIYPPGEPLRAADTGQSATFASTIGFQEGGAAVRELRIAGLVAHPGGTWAGGRGRRSGADKRSRSSVVWPATAPTLRRTPPPSGKRLAVLTSLTPD